MPGLTPDSIGIIDTSNSTTTPLAAFAEFVGSFTDVSEFNYVTVTYDTDKGSFLRGINLDWSQDGVNFKSQPFDYPGPIFTGSSFKNGDTFHANRQAKFLRVRYKNDFQAQTFFRLQTILSKGAFSGTVQRISPLQQITDHDIDAVSTQSIMVTQDVENLQFILPVSSQISTGSVGRGVLWVEQPHTGADFTRNPITKNASVTDQIIDAGFGEASRRFITVFNDTIRANLFIRMDGVASLTNYHFKVPPQHTWMQPLSWGMAAAELHGIWDAAETNGKARICENVRG